MVINTGKLFSGSWKTSLAGAVVVIAGLVYANPHDFVKYPMVVTIAKYLTLFAAAYGLTSAKDKNVTGGTTPNSANDPSVVAKTAAPEPPKQ